MKKLLLTLLAISTSTALAGLNISPAGTANGVPITPTSVNPATTNTGNVGTSSFGWGGLNVVGVNGVGFIGNVDNTAYEARFASNGTNAMSIQSGYLTIGTTVMTRWSPTLSGTPDLGIYRNAAGLLEINTGTAGVFQDLKVRKHFVDQTITAGGTTGAQTINKAAGTVNFAAAATSIVVTDSLVSTSSTIYCTVRTNDSTALLKNVVPAAGSFTINLNAAATAETSVGFLVVN